MKVSSVSPERCDTICVQPACLHTAIAASVSVTLPIWLTLISAELAARPRDRLGDDRRVGDEQVVAHDLEAVTEPLGETHPALPVAFGQSVFQAPHREVLDDRRVAADHVVARQGLARDVVAAVAEELARGRVQGDGHAVTARAVTGLVDRLARSDGEPLRARRSRGRSRPRRPARSRSPCPPAACAAPCRPLHRPAPLLPWSGAPIGATMNSWKSSLFGACTPPLRTLKCGTGSRGVTPAGLRERHSGTPAEAAIARAAAIDTPTMALAPSRALFSVPSSLISASSSSARSAKVRPLIASAISPLTARRRREHPCRRSGPCRRRGARPLRASRSTRPTVHLRAR